MEEMHEGVLTDEQLDGLFGSLRNLLSEQVSGKIRNIAGDAGFPLDMIPDGIKEGGIQRAPILNGIDGCCGMFPTDRRERTPPGLAEALGRVVGAVEVNRRIRKCGFHFENGGLVPVDATGQITV